MKVAAEEVAADAAAGGMNSARVKAEGEIPLAATAALAVVQEAEVPAGAEALAVEGARAAGHAIGRR